MTRLTLLAGGVGGAKMAEGFNMLKDVELTSIGNVADDDPAAAREPSACARLSAADIPSTASMSSGTKSS